MRHALRWIFVYVAGLALLTWLAHGVLVGTTRAWSEADLRSRAQLALETAHRGLVASWSGEDPEALLALLSDLTRDERIVGAGACAGDGTVIASSGAFDAAFAGSPELRRACALPASGEPAGMWTLAAEARGGRVHCAGLPLLDRGRALGVVVLLHDMNFVVQREATTRRLLLTAFVVLATSVTLVMLLSTRGAWRGWLRQVYGALTDQSPSGFPPLIGDVRELVERLSQERENEARDGRWTPERLRSTLRQHLHGERIVMLANREPYVHQREPDGSVRVMHPASGLVTALEPVMRACSGVWIAHGSGSADRESADARGRILVPPGEESYALRRIWLSEAEEAGYYYGFSNEGLWPLCHVAHERPVFRSSDWEHYRAINQRFADAVFEEVDVPDPIVLVQDYHFALAPKLIRERLPRATILAFWHIPWPNAERIGICPWREELLEGLLGSSILGFHTQQHCNNFLESVDASIESRIDREISGVIQHARTTLVRSYPISLEWPVRWVADLPDPATCRREIAEELGLGADALIGVGVDRLDYTKGIEERLQAVDELLTHCPEFRGRFTFIQLAAPSRAQLPRYRRLDERVRELAETINAKWGRAGYRPVILLIAHHEPPAVFRYYRAANVCYVSSLHDGMNLVAKEYVSARDDEQGVLVLSRFTGAARELTEALIVNPYDLREACAALAAALRMPADEQRVRMHAMRSLIAELNVYRWAGRMLLDAASLRRRERLTGSLSPIHLLSGLLDR